MKNVIPFAGKASSTLGTRDIFSSGTGFLGTSGTSGIWNITILSNQNRKCFKTASIAQTSTKHVTKVQLKPDPLNQNQNWTKPRCLR